MGRSFDGRGDQYALAMTVHEVLSGRNCMEGPTPSATVVNQTMVMPPALTELIDGFRIDCPMQCSEACARSRTSGSRAARRWRPRSWPPSPRIRPPVLVPSPPPRAFREALRAGCRVRLAMHRCPSVENTRAVWSAAHDAERPRWSVFSRRIPCNSNSSNLDRSATRAWRPRLTSLTPPTRTSRSPIPRPRTVKLLLNVLRRFP